MELESFGAGLIAFLRLIGCHHLLPGVLRDLLTMVGLCGFTLALQWFGWSPKPFPKDVSSDWSV